MPNICRDAQWGQAAFFVTYPGSWDRRSAPGLGPPLRRPRRPPGPGGTGGSPPSCLDLCLTSTSTWVTRAASKNTRPPQHVDPFFSRMADFCCQFLGGERSKSRVKTARQIFSPKMDVRVCTMHAPCNSLI